MISILKRTGVCKWAVYRDLGMANLPGLFFVFFGVRKIYIMGQWVEFIGYAASLLVAISLTMRSVLRLRILNLFGSLCFTIYGALIGAIPVALVNAAIVVINIYYLVEMLRTHTYFSTIDAEPDSSYVQAFLKFYAADIKRFFPDWSYQPAPDQVRWLILRDAQPVGLFVGAPDGQGGLQIQLDYVIPGYRDLKPGIFVYSQQAERFKALGIDHLYTSAATAPHRAYLRRMGFAPRAAAQGEVFWRAL
jgi:hypothetical protein